MVLAQLVPPIFAQDQAPKSRAVQEPRVGPLTNALSINTPENLADWQKRFTLGPGAAPNIGLYDQPASFRSGVVFGADGRITYLQARDVVAAG